MVAAHGAGSYAPVGELVPRRPDQYALLTGANSYVGPMIDKGYAVAYTRRSSAIGPGDDEQAVLDDGRTIGGLSFSYHTGLLRDFAQLARNLVTERLGRAPTRIYFYGHSAGGSLGRLMNYVPGANRDATGNPLFTGFIVDDAGGGYFQPRLLVDGRDVLFASPADRAAFAPQLEVAHQAYTGETGDYLQLKRENVRLHEPQQHPRPPRNDRRGLAAPRRRGRDDGHPRARRDANARALPALRRGRRHRAGGAAAAQPPGRRLLRRAGPRRGQRSASLGGRTGPGLPE